MSAADHIEVPRQHGLFKHHGIDLGDGTIAHYLEGREILRSSLKDFSAGQDCTVIIHMHSSPKEITLERAISRIGEKKYNLLFNNCEHFANWCKTGRHHSGQINNWINKASIAFLSVQKFLPRSLFFQLNKLLEQSFIDQSSEQKARKIIDYLNKTKEAMLRELELILEEINYYHDNSKQSRSAKKTVLSKNLLLKGQGLADQINSLENVEVQITNLLSKKDSKN